MAYGRDPNYGDSKGGKGGYSKKDELKLKAPPKGSQFAVDPELIIDGDYLASDINPDSLLADVEALLAQEGLLGEQTKWWEDRAHEEKATRRRLQDELKIQEASFKQEVLAIRREIAETRNQTRQEGSRREEVVQETAGLRAEAATARSEAEALKLRLERVAETARPTDAAKIHLSVSTARKSLTPMQFGNSAGPLRGSMSPTAGLSQAGPRPSAVSARPSAIRSSTMLAVPQAGGGTRLPTRGQGNMMDVGFADEDLDEDFGAFGSGPGGGRQSQAGGGGGLDLGGFDFDEDDDIDMDALGFG